jgi:hypothetical protein
MSKAIFFEFRGLRWEAEVQSVTSVSETLDQLVSLVAVLRINKVILKIVARII